MTTLKERFNKLLFKRVAKGVLATPALSRGQCDFTALSMVQHSDLVPYLLAIKSFILHAQPARVVVVADPTLSAEDRTLLRQHVPHIEVFEAPDFRRPSLPIGGTWERLSAISVLCSETAVVQLDADTLTNARPDEVIGAVVAGRSFILRSEPNVEIVNLAAAAAEGDERGKFSGHIQVLAESQLTKLQPPNRFRYARGCSGFTGFGRGAFDATQLDDISAQMRSIIGTRWNEWGTEQVTSNLVAASTPGAFMLPHPSYCNADSQSKSTRLAHYIGYARFTSRAYERQAAASIRSLQAA